MISRASWLRRARYLDKFIQVFVPPRVFVVHCSGPSPLYRRVSDQAPEMATAPPQEDEMDLDEPLPQRAPSPGPSRVPVSGITPASMRDLLKRPIFIQFVLYLVYRLLRLVVLIESDLYLLLKKILSSDVFSRHSGRGPAQDAEKEQNDDVELMNILWKKRLCPADVAREVDFLVFHSEMASFKVLDDPKWQLYTITGRHAYFVEMPFTISEYSFKFCDSVSEAQFAEAQRVARVSWDKFIQRCDKNWQFKGGLAKVIALTTMLNSGSSTLCSLVQQVADESPNPNSLVIFSKLDAFTRLAGFCENYDEFGVQRCRKMLLAMLRFVCKDQERNQTYILRLRPCCIRLVFHIHAVAPFVMNCFMARDQLENSISLFVEPKSENEADYSKLSIVLRNTCKFLADIPTVCLGEQLSVNMVRPDSLIQLAVSLICSSVINYKRQKKYYTVPVIYYEQLIAETRKNLETLFDLCGLTGLRISDSLVEDAKELGKREASYVRDLFGDEKPVIESAAQLLESYYD